MEVTVTAGSPAASRAAWVCLLLAWVCFIVPIPGIGLFVGWPLNFVAFILAIVAMAKRGVMSGLIQLLASLVASPIVYVVGLAIFGAALTGVNEAAEKADASAHPSDAAPMSSGLGEPVTAAVAADALSVAASELFSAYEANEIAADQKYKGKRLRVDAVIGEINSDLTDDPELQLQAGGFLQFVTATGVPSADAAQLSKGQRIELLCTGGGEILGFPRLDECVLVK